MDPRILLALLPILSTFIGGYVVYRWKHDLHPWLSLSGGILLGVAFLDLLPEALEKASEIGIGPSTILGASLATILFFHIVDTSLSVHSHHEHPHGEPEEHCDNRRHKKASVWLRVCGLMIHSLLDGLAIGGGFAVDTSLGILVTVAVITHDFSDGMSTVTILKNALGHNHKSILPLLVVNALAPFIGAIIGFALAPSVNIIAHLLAAFAGFFIFLSLAELLPSAHSGEKPRRFGLVLTVLGILIVIGFRSIADV